MTSVDSDGQTGSLQRPKAPCSSYDRLNMALGHTEPDRVPFDLGGLIVSSINVVALRSLRAYLGLPDTCRVLDQVTQGAELSPDIIERLGADVLHARPATPTRPGLAHDLGLQGDYFRLVDEFGMGWQMPKVGGHYYDLHHSPLASAESTAEIARYPWPDPLDPARFEHLVTDADRIVLEEQKGLVIERMHSGMWEHAMWMRGYEQFFMDMAADEAMVHAIMTQELEIKMKYWGRVLELCTNHTLVISEADDLGGQNGLLVSLEMYKRLIWPYHKRLFDFIKSKAKTKVYIFYHNDGAIYETLPLLVEAGVDIMNPWQVNCKGMDDTKRFKREWGKDLTIWGGSCDTQRVLPFGTPQEVRDETRRRIEDLAPGGGFVFAPIHILQEGVPPQNIMAWWETLQEYGAY